MGDTAESEMIRYHDAAERAASRIAELEADNDRMRKRLNGYAEGIGTGSPCKTCGRFYLHRDGCQPCRIRELETELAAIAKAEGEKEKVDE